MEKRFTIGVQETLRFNPDSRLSKRRLRDRETMQRRGPWRAQLLAFIVIRSVYSFYNCRFTLIIR
jgi:hypothetical protein